MFLVQYIDDYKQTHICVASDVHELNWLKDRFGEIDYEVIMK